MRQVTPVQVECAVVCPLILPDGYGRFRLFSRGKKQEYNVAALKDEQGRIVGFAVHKDNGTTYSVDVRPDCWTCECGDFEWRRRQLDPCGCKHVITVRMFLDLCGYADLFQPALVLPDNADTCVYGGEEW